MTALVARNTSGKIWFLSSSADEPLMHWTIKLVEEYISIPAEISALPRCVLPASLTLVEI